LTWRRQQEQQLLTAERAEIEAKFAEKFEPLIADAFIFS